MAHLSMPVLDIYGKVPLAAAEYKTDISQSDKAIFYGTGRDEYIYLDL